MANYKVLTAVNGKNGLEVARNNLPDLILCDIMMPELDGYGVLRAIQNIPDLFEIPFILVSAKAEKKDFVTEWILGLTTISLNPLVLTNC